MDEMFEIIKAGPQNAPPEQALYRIQHTYSDGSESRLNVDWDGLLRLHEVIHDRIAMEGCVCENLRHPGLPPSGDLGNRVPRGRGIRPPHLLV